MIDAVFVKTRCCTKCGCSLPESSFYKTVLKATGRVQYHAACKTCYKQRMKKYEDLSKERNDGLSRSVASRTKNLQTYAAHIVNSAKFRAKKKNMDFLISAEWLLSALERQEWSCAISGVRMVVSAGTGKRLFNGISVDRIDNSKGYTPENCWLVCYSINTFKADADLARVIEICKSVAKKWDC
jgi:hypothetical protein